LGERPEYATPASRHENRRALTEILDAEFRQHSTEDWLARLQGVLPVAPVRDLRHALTSDFVRESGMIAQFEHPLNPELRMLSSPLKFNGTRPALTACSPIGADTQAVLASLPEGALKP